MLKKLLALEFSATCRPFLVLYGATALLILLELLGFQVRQPLMGALSMVAAVLLSIVLLVLTVVLVAKRYSANLFGNEGYFMLALPVSAPKLLLAKFLPAVLWISISCLFFLLSQFSGIFAVSPEERAYVLEVMDQAYAELGFLSLREFFSLLPLLFISGFISTLFFVALLYFSITLANTSCFQRHSGLFAVLLFFGFYIGYGALEILFSALVPLSLQVSGEGWRLVAQKAVFGVAGAGFQFGLTSFLLSIIAIFLLFWFNVRLIQRRISLK